MRSLRSRSRSTSSTKTNSTRKARLRLEILEDRCVLDAGLWMAVFGGVDADVDLIGQAQVGRNHLEAAGIDLTQVEVAEALDLAGTFVLQTSIDVTQEQIQDLLDDVGGFVYVEEFSRLAQDSFEIREENPKKTRSEAAHGPFDYDVFVAQEQEGKVPDQSGDVGQDPEIVNVLTNNNGGNTGTANFTQSETTVIAFGNTVVIGFNDSGSNAGGTNKFTGFSRSIDGGVTFTDGGTLPTNANGDAGDPVLARHNASGRIYYSTLQFSGSGIRMFRSDDNGATWMAPTQAAPGKTGFQDKQWHTVDNFAGAGNGNVYMIVRDFGGGNGIFMFRSTDGGATFGPNGGTLIASGSGGNVQGAYVAVAPDHSVYAYWFDDGANALRVRRSTDFGVTFGPPVLISAIASTGTNGDLALNGQRNGTTTLSGFRSNTFLHAAINPITGHQYVTYADNPVGSDKADIFFRMSTDNGATWSAATRVNSDAGLNDQWQPTIAVTPDGSRLGIFWYDRREDTGTGDGDLFANNKFKYYGRIATISGSTVTFGADFAVSDVASLPEFGRDGVVNGVYMGDYDMTAATNDAFHVVWADNRAALPGGGTRMDPSVFYKKISLGLSVIATTPAVGSVVGSVPLNYIVDFSEPINGASVQATDFTVTNNVGTPVPATSFVINTPTRVTFTFAAPPFTNQGPHTMAMAAGSVTRLSDGNPLNAFSGAFNFDLVPLAVTTTVPPNGGTFTLPAPFTYDVNFNEMIAAGSVTTDDLNFSGVAGAIVTGAIALDADTARYTISGVTTAGALNIGLAAGKVTDVFGNPNLAFAGTYTVVFGGTAPRVTATNVAPNGVVAPGNLSYQVTFNQPMKVSNLTSDDFSLRGNIRAVNYAASSFSFNGAGTVLTLNYVGLPDDDYTLTLIAGVNGGTNFTSAGGMALDGEFVGAFPSGNGAAGGNFIIGFDADLLTEAYPVPLAAKNPLGSLIYDPSITRTIAFPGDIDNFTINVDAGQTISVIVTPLTAALQPRVELFTPANVSLGFASAVAAGQVTGIETRPAATGGNYRIQVNGLSNTQGLYRVEVILNAAFEVEGRVAGSTNNTAGTAQNIDGMNGSFIDLDTTLAHGQRGAALGTTDLAAGYSASTVAFGFTDISGTGNISIATGDDSSQTLNAGQLAGFTFSFFGTTHTSVGFSTNGLVTFPNGDATFTNSNLSTSPAQAAIAALWDDLFNANTGNQRIYWQVVGTGAGQQLIIQWNNITQLGGVAQFSFQAILSRNGTVRLNYDNRVTTANVVNSATVGVKGPGTVNPPRLLLSFNQAQGTFVGPNVSTVLTPAVPTADFYSFTATAGQRVSLALTNLAAGNVDVQLIAPNGTTVLASGSAGTANLNEAIQSFLIGATGTYFARISGDSIVPYSLVVTKDAIFDVEPNSTQATARDATGTQGALGHVQGGSTAGTLFDLPGTVYTGSRILIGTKITLGINNDGSFITGAGGTGILYNGVEFVVPGSPVASFTVGRNGQNFTNNAANGISQITITERKDISSGTFRGVKITGVAGGNVRVERVVAFNAGDDHVTIQTRLTNLSGATLTSVATLENIDPDQDFNTFGTFNTLNDVVLGNEFVRGSGPSSGLTVGLGSGDTRRVVSAEGFNNTDPFAIINSPVDPNGASGDIAIALAFNIGPLTAGASTTTSAIMAFGTSAAAADAVYTANKSGTSIANDDWYRFTLGAGETVLEVETRTPADGPGQFVNVLNPKIQLFNAAGVDITPTVTILGDGRNERFRATGLTPGTTYFVKVSGEAGTAGEYFAGIKALTTPTPTVLVDNTNPLGFRVYGAGWNLVAGGHGGSRRTHAPGLASEYAEWRYGQNFIAGTSYDFFVTWVANAANASNATYKIFDGAAQIGTVVLNQKIAPNDAIAAGGTLWEKLFTFTPATTGFKTIRVQLGTVGANGTVVADALFDPPQDNGLTSIAEVAGTFVTDASPVGLPPLPVAQAPRLQAALVADQLFGDFAGRLSNLEQRPPVALASRLTGVTDELSHYAGRLLALEQKPPVALASRQPEVEDELSEEDDLLLDRSGAGLLDEVFSDFRMSEDRVQDDAIDELAPSLIEDSGEVELE